MMRIWAFGCENEARVVTKVGRVKLHMNAKKSDGRLLDRPEQYKMSFSRK